MMPTLMAFAMNWKWPVVRMHSPVITTWMPRMMMDPAITSRASVARMQTPATTTRMPCTRMARAITAAMLDVQTHLLVTTIQTS